jgi:hypothetical protein
MADLQSAALATWLRSRYLRPKRYGRLGRLVKLCPSRQPGRHRRRTRFFRSCHRNRLSGRRGFNPFLTPVNRGQNRGLWLRLATADIVSTNPEPAASRPDRHPFGETLSR